MSDLYRSKSVNCILVKDSVGRAKPTCYSLPGAGFAYGRAEAPDLEGAREVTMHWAAHVPRPRPDLGGQDFKKLNKIAAKANVVNAKQLAQFKTGQDIKVLPQAASGPLPKVIPSDVIPSFAYGRKSRPSTPAKAVIGGQYASEWEDAVGESYRRYEMEKEASDAKIRVKLTKASNARISNARTRRELSSSDAPEIPRFTLSKFKNVRSRLQLEPLSTALNSSSSMPALQSEPDVPDFLL